MSTSENTKATTTFNGEVHPVAALFPMLPSEELQELADSIKRKGQLHPIVLSASGRLLDGRNRLAACELAKVEPVFEVYDGDEDDYALEGNLARRHLTKGQRAMIAAQSKLLVTNNQTELSKVAEVSRSGIAQASTVVKFAPDLVEQVISGALGLMEAYRTAQSRKVATKQTTQTLQELQEKAPDLAELVTEERMSLAEAHAASQERAKDDQERLDRCIERCVKAEAAIETLLKMTTLDEWPKILASMSDDDAARRLALIERLR
jgi:ParB/RepB/Spo0J family partition protein